MKDFDDEHPHHSAYNQKRSSEYDRHTKNIEATRIQYGQDKMTQARSLLKNDEDEGEEF